MNDPHFARPASDTFRKAKSPPHRGQVRFKMWRSPLPLNAEGMTETWTKRAKAYWERQGRLFGFRIAGCTVENGVVDGVDDMTLVVSRAVVDDVMPGSRV